MHEWEQEKKKPGLFGIGTLGEAVDVFSVVARIHEHALSVFLRTGFGSQYFGWLAAAAWLVVVWLSGVYHDILMFRYAFVMLAVQVYHRAVTVYHWFKGEHEHSDWHGYSWLPFGNETAKAIEPFLAFVIGSLITPYSYILGRTWMYGLFSLGYLHIIRTLARAARKRKIRDDRIAAEDIARLLNDRS